MGTKAQKFGGWVAREVCGWSVKGGLTTNSSEGFNYLLKALQDWKEIPPDSLLLALNMLQAYYMSMSSMSSRRSRSRSRRSGKGESRRLQRKRYQSKRSGSTSRRRSENSMRRKSRRSSTRRSRSRRGAAVRPLTFVDVC